MYNANNYGYNPYGTYIPQRPIQQPMQQPLQTPVDINRPILNGKQVDSIEVVKAMDIPLDGSVSYFPLADGSAIVSKQLQIDGTSKITIFKPVEQQKDEVKYITHEDIEKALEKVEFSELDDIKDEIKEIRQDIKELKKRKKDD